MAGRSKAGPLAQAGGDTRVFGGRFLPLLEKYSVPLRWISPAEGRWDDGKYQPGVSRPVELWGALRPLPDSLLHMAGGALSVRDRELYLPSKPCDDWQGAKVEHGGQRYAVEGLTDHTEYGDVAVYLLKWVSAFD